MKVIAVGPSQTTIPAMLNRLLPSLNLSNLTKSNNKQPEQFLLSIYVYHNVHTGGATD